MGEAEDGDVRSRRHQLNAWVTSGLDGWAAGWRLRANFLLGDNQRDLEGTPTGSFNELTFQNGIALTPEQQLSLIDQYGGLDAWGTDAFEPHYAAAWAWAGNTPFQWGKQCASHLGGTCNATVVSWPERIKDAGGLRTQFTHVIDIGPTILEAAGIPEPTVVDGTAQKPMEGTSFLYTFEDPNAAERHTRPVLRDPRQPRHLQGWLVGRLRARPHPLGCDTSDAREVRSRNLRPGAGHLGVVLPPRRLLPSRRPGRRRTRRSSPS